MTSKKDTKECFTIMPISDPEGYGSGHFRHVYNNIISPACELAGYNAIRADEVKETNLIHLDILKKLIDTPIAVCDLSNRNPNVLFELGIRQAFDKPVVLIQEKGTPKIFDISPLRILDYSKDMKYHEVLQSQKMLSETINATIEANTDGSNVNSIVKLLALNNSATIPELENGKDKFAMEYVQAELKDLRKILEISMINRDKLASKSITAIEYERLSKELSKIRNSKNYSFDEKEYLLRDLLRDGEDMISSCKDDNEYKQFNRLISRIDKTIMEMGM